MKEKQKGGGRKKGEGTGGEATGKGGRKSRRGRAVFEERQEFRISQFGTV